MRRSSGPGRTLGFWGHVRATFDFADVGLGDLGSKVTILLSSIAGSPRAIKADIEDALIVVRYRGNPTFFITFIYNPN